jgi:hypothetical protein
MLGNRYWTAKGQVSFKAGYVSAVAMATALTSCSRQSVQLRDSDADCGKFGPGATRPHDPMGVQRKLLRCTLVEVMVSARRVLQMAVL